MTRHKCTACVIMFGFTIKSFFVFLLARTKIFLHGIRDATRSQIEVWECRVCSALRSTPPSTTDFTIPVLHLHIPLLYSAPQSSSQSLSIAKILSYFSLPRLIATHWQSVHLFENTLSKLAKSCLCGNHQKRGYWPKVRKMRNALCWRKLWKTSSLRTICIICTKSYPMSYV
jgi:hypothetical protein